MRQKINAYPKDADQKDITIYQREVREIIDHCDGLSTPQIAEKIYALRSDLFGEALDYATIKSRFNHLMLSMLPYMRQQVTEAEDPLKMAVQYAMAGNYIDFGVLSNVNETELRKQLDEAVHTTIEPEMLESFRTEMLRARHLVYFTDNCGEIVADKLLISVLREMNPNLTVTVIVRGLPAINDATLEDAAQIGMGEAASRVIGNGAGMPGNVIGAISEEAMDEISRADVLIAKGQGNYEGLSGCGLNIFYFFLCKCELFMRRFKVPQFTGIMTRER